jgi:exopolyphosphatase/guanosine-5'-triphosphate,3'-diphosphate pyrophosphatase
VSEMRVVEGVRAAGDGGPAAPVPQGPPPILSVIDVGSSGLRMLLAELHADDTIRVLEELERPLALGRETFHTGTLSAASMSRAVHILRQFKERMEAYGVTHTRAVATSAVRAALNRDTFVDRVFLATGIEVDVIEGAQETLLTFAAVQGAMASHPEYREGEALMFELGGGASEWALMRDGEVVASITHDFGTVRMREMLREGAGDRRARTRVIQHGVKEMLNAVRASLPFERLGSLVAVGSEARFAARALAPGGGELPELSAIAAKDLRKLADQILAMSPDEVAASYSITAGDAESLGPAFLAFAELIRLSPVDRLLVPRASMRDGLLLQMVRSFKSGATMLFPEQTIAAALSLARKYHADEKHGITTAALARALFDATASQHRMGEKERLLLEVASIVHDIGQYVAVRGHHRHTYYLVSHSEIFGLSSVDLEVVANVARYHRRSGPQSDHPAYASLPRAARLNVNRLSAILRVADALDKSHAQRIQDPRFEVAGGELVIHVPPGEDLALERMALDAKGSLFEEVFGLRPVLVETA